MSQLEVRPRQEAKICNICGEEMEERECPTYGKYWVCCNCFVSLCDGEEQQDYPPLHDMVISLGG